MQNPKITKIRTKSDGARITYSIGSSTVVLSGTAPIGDVFANALAALVPNVVKLLGLPARYAEGLNVTGATFADRADAETVVLIAKKKLKAGGSELVLTTPSRFMSEPLADAGSSREAIRASAKLCVDDVLREKLVALRDAAAGYVRSSPEQRQLYLDLEGEGAKTATG